MTKSCASFDEEIDILVIGYGFAGASAAITAYDAGSSVTIVEKMPNPGGNSRYSYGHGFVAHDSEQSIVDLIAWLDAMCLHTTPVDVLEAFARGTRELPAFVEALGGKFSLASTGAIAQTFPHTVPGPNFPHIAPPRPMFDKRCVEGPAGEAPSLRLWKLLSANVEKREINVHLGCPAKDLVTDEGGRVIGAVVEIKGVRKAIRARQAVLMTCGGFIANDRMRHDYLPSKPMKFAGNPGNTGDGIAMVTKVGADLWHMTRTSTFIGFQSPDHEAAFCIFFTGKGFLWVDRNAQRFVDETSVELHDFDRVFSHLDPDHVDFPRNPSWAIFDEEIRAAGPMTWPVAGYNRDTYSWSTDNSSEIEKGWIVRAETLAELAAKTELCEASLRATLDDFNATILSGHAPKFERPREKMKRIDPPYYAIKLHPTALNTQGGPRRDKDAHVLDAAGQPIPGLYAAGEFGSIWGYLYPGGGNITEALVFGRIAGRNAATGKRLAGT